jgi:hypothetical protein
VGIGYLLRGREVKMQNKRIGGVRNFAPALLGWALEYDGQTSNSQDLLCRFAGIIKIAGLSFTRKTL